MLTKTEAIVLHSLKYGERRIIIKMFTRAQGCLSFVAPAPQSGRSRLKKQYFQPLTLLNIEADVRANQQLHRLADASLLAPLSSLLSSPVKLSIGLFVSEFLYHALREEQQNVPLFDYLRSSIEWLDGASLPSACGSLPQAGGQRGSLANFHLVLLMRVSRFLGFWPNLESAGGYFDLRAATFCATAPVHRDFLLPAEADRLRTLMRMDYPTMHLFRLSRAERAHILDLLLLYYRLHLPAFPELRSLGVLHELYN